MIFFSFFVNDKVSLQNLRYIVKSFEMASGLKINLHKSALASINVNEASFQMAKNIWDCSITSIPIDYLGMPLGGSPKSESFWNPIIECIDRKLHSWQHSYISKGGRLTLIQVVLSNLPTYYLSLFRAPVAVCKSIERKWRNFLWEGTDDKGGSHLVRWDIITCLKNKGGLGIDRVLSTNDALISKWIWRYFTEPNHLWRLLIENKYSSTLPSSIPTKCNFSSVELSSFNIYANRNRESTTF